MTYEAIERFQAPPGIIEVPLMAAFAVVGIIGNIIILAWLHHDHSLNTPLGLPPRAGRHHRVGRGPHRRGDGAG